MVTGSITLSALFSFQPFYLPRLSFFLSNHTIFPLAIKRFLGLYHSCMFCFTVFCTLTEIFKLLPNLISSTSLCLSWPVILPSPNHLPASPSRLSLPHITPSLTPPKTPGAPASRQLITEPAPDELSFVVKFLIIALGLQVFLRCPSLNSITLSLFLSLLTWTLLLLPTPLDTVEINIFSQSNGGDRGT